VCELLVQNIESVSLAISPFLNVCYEAPQIEGTAPFIPYNIRQHGLQNCNPQHITSILELMCKGQRRRLRVASGATAPGLALEGAPRFRPKVILMSLSSYILQ